MSEAEGMRERWYEPELQRIAGTVAQKQAEPDAGKAEAYFERALAVARSNMRCDPEPHLRFEDCRDD